MVKDRLAELHICRDQSICNNFKDKADPTVLDAVFLDTVTSLLQTLDELRDYINEVHRIHKDILAQPQRSPDLDRRLEQLTNAIRNKAFHVRSSLKEFDQENTDQSPLLINARNRVRSAHLAAITRQLIDVMNKYSRIQLDYREKCKSTIRGQLVLAGSQFSEDQLEDMLENKNPQIFTQSIMATTEAAKRSLSDIEARHADIIRLEKGIEELRDLFVTMALTVDNQSELVDRIEYNVNKTVDSVVQAKRKLSDARKQRSKNRRRRMICFVILFVVAILAIIAIASAIGLT